MISLAAILFTYVLVIDSMAGGTDACMCMPIHPQAAFCRSQFVMEARVISNRIEKKLGGSEIFIKLGLDVPVFVHYNVLVSKVYKGLSKITNVTGFENAFLFKVPVHTSHSGAMCGIKLKRNKKYIIMGRVIGNQLQINHCDYLEEYKKVSDTVRDGLNGKYNCDCPVNTCVDGYCDRQGGCKWNIGWDTPVDQCIQKHRFCEKVEDNTNSVQCKWSTDESSYNVCKKTQILNRIYS